MRLIVTGAYRCITKRLQKIDKDMADEMNQEVDSSDEVIRIENGKQ